eukprot:1687213-Pyramimonas_sp.AAC.1
MTLTKTQTVSQSSSSIRPSSDVAMRQTGGSDVCESTHVITSPAAPRQPSLVQKTESISQDDSKNTIVSRICFEQQIKF